MHPSTGPAGREARALEAEIARLAEGYPDAAGILGVDLGQPAAEGRFVERKIEGRGRGRDALQVLGEEGVARARLEAQGLDEAQALGQAGKEA